MQLSDSDDGRVDQQVDVAQYEAPAIEPAPKTYLQFSFVITAFTPGIAAAFDVSILRMRACGWGERTITA